MENGQLTRMEGESEKKVDISDDSIKSAKLESTERDESENSHKTMTATMQKGSQKTSKNVDYQVLKLKAGIVAGALADFQRAGGIVVSTKKEYERSGSKYLAVKLFLVVENMNVVAVKTADGIDFDIVAVDSLLTNAKKSLE